MASLLQEPEIKAQSSSLGIFEQIERARKSKRRISVPVKKIRPPENSPRGKSAKAGQDELSASLAIVGPFSSVLLRRIPVDQAGREFELVDGESLWEDARTRSGNVEADMIDCDDAMAAGVIAAVLNIGRRDYSFMAKSNIVHLLKTDPRSNATHEQIGALLLMHKETVGKYHALQRLQPKARKLLDVGTLKPALPLDVVVALSRLHVEGDSAKTEALQLKWANTALEQGITSAAVLGELIRVPQEEKKLHGNPQIGPGVRARPAPVSPSRWKAVARAVKRLRDTAEHLEKYLFTGTIPKSTLPTHPMHEVVEELQAVKAAVDGMLKKLGAES